MDENINLNITKKSTDISSSLYVLAFMTGGIGEILVEFP